VTPRDLAELAGPRGVVEIPRTLKDWLGRPKPLLVNGEHTPARAGGRFVTSAPATEEPLAEVADAGAADVDDAVLGARHALEKGPWRRMSRTERATILRRLSALILEKRADLAILETLDTGKPIRESFDGDIPRAASNFSFFADFAEAEAFPEFRSGGYRHETARSPVGVAALITPWNLPLYLETWKLAPALMMGNSCILKPSELTPLTACYLGELTLEAGLPPGVLQILHGGGKDAAGERLVSHPGVDAISFTGETTTGREIMKAAASGPARISFELGGKGASLVFADCDVSTAAAQCARAAFRNQGEICLAGPRIFVERPLYAEFRRRFLEQVSALKLGDPLDLATSMGALISAEHREKVRSYIDGAPDRSCLLTGGRAASVAGRGHFFEPTVLEAVPLDHRISREEIFGPVATLYAFDTEEEAVSAANSTPYGLSASVWTAAEERARRVSADLDLGLVWINSWFVRDLRVPFGGCKRSGVGREGGRFSLDFFSEWKSICHPERGPA